MINFNKISLILFSIFLSITIDSYCQELIVINDIIPQGKNDRFNVYQTIQDHTGKIWMLSDEGIIKYDGQDFHLVSKDVIFQKASQYDVINKIVKGQNDTIWITTTEGRLAYYNTHSCIHKEISDEFKTPIELVCSKTGSTWIVSKKGELFHKTKNEFHKITTFPDIDGVNTIINSLDFNKTHLTIGVSSGKVYCYSFSNKTTETILPKTKNHPNAIYVKIDKQNKLWIVSENYGVFTYSLSKKEFISSDLLSPTLALTEKAILLGAHLDSKDNLWCFSDGDGLFKIITATGETQQHLKNLDSKYSLHSNSFIDVNEDKNNNFWLIDKNASLAVGLKRNPAIGFQKVSDHTSSGVLCIFQDSDNTIWLGTDGQGLYKKDATSYFDKYLNIKENLCIQTITEEENSKLWCGTYRKGLWILDKETNTFKRSSILNSKNQAATDVRVLFKDSKNRIWVGSNTSIDLYKNKKLLSSFYYGEKGLNGQIPESIAEDKNGIIWVGMDYGGLHKFNENANNIENSLFSRISNPIDQHLPRAISITPGSGDNIWFINGANSLSSYTITTNEIKNYSIDNYKSLRALQSLIKGSKEELWIGTNQGILKYHLKSKKSLNYTITDGFYTNYFLPRSIFITNNNLLYLGCSEGVAYFNPNELKKTNGDYIFSLKNIKLSNLDSNLISLDEKEVQSVLNSGQLTCESFQNSFSIEYTAIDNILDSNLLYSHKLNGHDTDWSALTETGEVSYKNLPSGNYTLEMNVISKDINTIVAQKKLQIHISTPLILSNFAILSYVIGFLIFIVFSIILLKKWKQQKTQKAQFTNKVSQEKLNFYSNMSHELQTPLTLINLPIDEIFKDTDLDNNPLLEERLQIIRNNINKLTRIANDMNLIGHKSAPYNEFLIEHVNLKEHISKIHLSFKELARTNHINFELLFSIEFQYEYYDKNKIEHILFNLISNAFKYTPHFGQIVLKVSNNQEHLIFTITDSGIGIEKKDINNIFKRFYRSTNKLNKKGKGIGLNLTKFLVNALNGTLEVTSTIGEGSKFIITLPRKLHTEEVNKLQTDGTKVKPTGEQISQTKNNLSNKKNKTILIVDDNAEIQNHLEHLLCEQYNLIFANNGHKALKLALKHLPNLILTDILMPVMTGIQLCEHLNSNPKTEHIPVFIITGKSSVKNKYTGLELGAVEFINKPFDSKELLLKITNTINSQNKLASNIKKTIIKNPVVNAVESSDDKFLRELYLIVNERLSDPNFKVEELSESLNISYSSLYRKCKSTTGLNLKEYIKTLRLKKAAYLLVQSNERVSDISYNVGFNNPKYFTKKFKDHFKITPKQFRNKYLDSKNKKNFLKKHEVNIHKDDH